MIICLKVIPSVVCKRKKPKLEPFPWVPSCRRRFCCPELAVGAAGVVRMGVRGWWCRGHKLPTSHPGLSFSVVVYFPEPILQIKLQCASSPGALGDKDPLIESWHHLGWNRPSRSWSPAVKIKSILLCFPFPLIFTENSAFLWLCWLWGSHPSLVVIKHSQWLKIKSPALSSH